jgi:hypothetical protein
MADDLVVGIAEAEDQLIQQLVRAGAQADPIDPDAVFRAERGAQREAGRVGVQVQGAERGADRLDGARRRPQRVLVGRHLHRLPRSDAELALELLDGLAGLVGVEAAHVARRDGIDPGLGHVSSALR